MAPTTHWTLVTMTTRWHINRCFPLGCHCIPAKKSELWRGVILNMNSPRLEGNSGFLVHPRHSIVNSRCCASGSAQFIFACRSHVFRVQLLLTRHLFCQCFKRLLNRISAHNRCPSIQALRVLTRSRFVSLRGGSSLAPGTLCGRMIEGKRLMTP